MFDPEAGMFDPEAGMFDPEAGMFDPEAGMFDPVTESFDPDAAPRIFRRSISATPFFRVDLREFCEPGEAAETDEWWVPDTPVD